MKLQDFAAVVRSKNSGPFELTFDILFKNAQDYQHFIDAKVLTPEIFASMYHIDPKQIITFEHFDAAFGIKITIPRPWPQGTFGESDMHGSQQYAPLLAIDVP